MKFIVATEARGHQFDVIVEAETIGEAVKIVKEKHCGPRMVEVTPYPTWAEPLPEGKDPEEIYELTYEIHGACEDCKTTLFNTKTPEQSEWEWTYASGDDGCHTDICYPCAQKRKEAGNYCAQHRNYYRDDHHHGCDSCPVGDCSKARDRYFKILRAALVDALRHSNASITETNEFLDVNEFGLAFDELQAGGERSKGFETYMEKAKAMMDKGWW